ncbi:MAG: (d)CMP kinase [Candidatus Methylacidiphilales bacterium]|nr:(d)CMP kinase [Candidatus Methylacidiphilales bacterium]
MILNPVIAIDGPAASGKSTVARLVARHLNFVYVDTGAMYRSYAWLALEKTCDPTDRAAVKALIAASRLETLLENGSLELRLDGTDPTPHIRAERINAVVSQIASIPELREFLVIRQRELRNRKPLVMEGRDIGTVVFTDTPHKYYIDADPAVRDARRRNQGQTDALAQRDAIDRGRRVAPLTMAADARLIDSTHLSAESIAREIVEELKVRGIQSRA